MYHVDITRTAFGQLEDLPDEVFSRVRTAIEALAAKPRPLGCTKLTASELWRIRIGAYRVIYSIDDTERRVTIVKIGHRRDVYR